MTPLEITIDVGQRVTFVNNDVRAHDVVGGADPSHPDCPEILQAGFLAAGQRSDTGVFTSVRTCAYHDHTALGVPAFSGRIIIK
jgi:plastocyanin